MITKRQIVDVETIVDIGLAFSSERDTNKLLNLMLTEIRRISNCDAGTLYLKDENTLVFKIMHNDTFKTVQGVDGEKINLPPVVLDPNNLENVSSYVAITGNIVNIEDVYEETEFNFTGPKKYDEITGYRSKSMMVFPLKNNQDEIIGVLQLINAKDFETGEVIAFDVIFERVLTSLASIAAVALTNMKYTEEIKELFNSFVQVMATAVDERSKYNSNHTKNIVRLVGLLANYYNKLYEKGETKEYFDANRKEQLEIAAWLHDIGKIVTPLEVMDKGSRLAGSLTVLQKRFDIFKQRLLIEQMTNQITKEQMEQKLSYLNEAEKTIIYANEAPLIGDDDIEKFKEYSKTYYSNAIGDKEPLISSDDLKNLSIRRGTLTDEERSIMNGHVVVTARLLDKIKFTEQTKNIPLIAKNHHEHLDGKGYPKGLNSDTLTFDMRILTIIDIFEALTASDRPYKKAMTPTVAIKILREMADEGKVDSSIVDVLEKSRIWE